MPINVRLGPTRFTPSIFLQDASMPADAWFRTAAMAAASLMCRMRLIVWSDRHESLLSRLRRHAIAIRTGLVEFLLKLRAPLGLDQLAIECDRLVIESQKRFLLFDEVLTIAGRLQC